MPPQGDVGDHGERKPSEGPDEQRVFPWPCKLQRWESDGSVLLGEGPEVSSWGLLEQTAF